ncbi:MAG: glycosyltransferase [Candidatus Omnitrophica bacterium]|nr:glycosyltransferase [Candidatus Omnitrophota bacterium]
MYISEISGHHSATLAIEKAIKMIRPKTEILNINAFNYTNPISEKIVNRIYMTVIKKTPRIWEYLYDNPQVAKKIENLKKTVHRFNSPKLRRLFEQFKPDAVVCTQAFPCGMVADYKKEFNSKLPLVAVLTDYIPHSYWIYDAVDYYIAPSQEVASRMMAKGVPQDKIKIFGIPFDPDFNIPQDKEEIISRLKLKTGIPTLLIMGGGQGLGPIKTIVSSLEKIEFDLQEIIITGTNKKLYKSLKRKIKKYKKRLLLFGYVNNINELMTVSDVIITKPGGITCAEALSKRLPMIITKPIPGQEVSNTRYLTAKGVAVKIDKPKEINLVVKDLLKNPLTLKRMRESIDHIRKPNASLDIAKFLLSM